MAVSAMHVRALRISVLKSAGNFTRDECHDLSAEKIQRVKCFMFTRSGICCVLAIFERRRGRLGSKISGCGQLAEVAVYFGIFAVSYLAPPAQIRTGPIRAYGLYGAFFVKEASRHFCGPSSFHSFVRPAPQAFFRPDRTFASPSRAAAVKDGASSAPPKAWTDASTAAGC